MTNFFRYILNITVLFVVTGLCVSCGENGALKERTVYFHEDHAKWMTPMEPGDQFLVQDCNGVTQSFMMREDNYYFGKSWGSFLFVNTDMLHTEYHYQSFGSLFGLSYSQSLTANEAPFGDELYITMEDVAFAYDLTVGVVSRIYCGFGNKSMLMTDQGYEEQEPIYSEVVIRDTMVIGGQTYQEVLHFVLADFEESWEPYTPAELFVAKGAGFVRCIFAGGMVLTRK